MTEYKEIDKELCRKKYSALEKNIHANIKDVGWNLIKDNEEILREAINFHREGNRYVVNGISICESILLNYGEVNEEIYQHLVDFMFTNSNIFRIREYIVPEGYEAPSFLMLVLMNPRLRLTEEQKDIIVGEGNNCYDAINNRYRCIAHGMGPYDIRYWILRNPNWSLEEKENLVSYFWPSLEDFKKVCERWESDFINNPANKDKNGNIPNLTRISEKLIDLRELYDDEDTINRISFESDFLSMVYDILIKREAKVQKKSLRMFGAK